MIEIIQVHTPSALYEVMVGPELLNQIGQLAKGCFGPRKAALISDTTVYRLYGENVKTNLSSNGFEVFSVIVPAGEHSKSMIQAEQCCREMIAAGLDRNSVVFALGGGVVGDLAGFVASIYLRGIPYIQVPTTIVSQVDSSIGGKTGVNTDLGKNLIGTFWHPALVVADVTTLSTLPDREYNEGFAEIIKHAIIRDAAMLHDCEAMKREAAKTEPFSTEDSNSLHTRLIAHNVRIKTGIVAEDEKEHSGLRALLNFGHTIGHAIENAAGYGRLLHGEAISLGIIAALFLSAQKAGLSQDAFEQVLQKLEAFNLPTRLDSSITDDQILHAMRSDKKFVSGNIRFILTREIGSAFVSDKVTHQDIQSALDYLRKRAS